MLRSLLFTLCLFSVTAWSQQHVTEPAHVPLRFEPAGASQDKNFWLLSQFEKALGVRGALKADPALAKLMAAKLGALDNAAKSCGPDLDCHTAAFRWKDADASAAGDALAALYPGSPALKSLADVQLRASGMYVRYQKSEGGELLRQAWLDCVRGINHIIDVYAAGKPPRYPAIDSMTWDPKSDAWRRTIANLTAVLEDDRASLDGFWSPSLRFAMEAMSLNSRDETARHEPMEMRENAAAFRRIKAIDWTKYPYSVIVVPGSGSDRPGVRLSPNGKLRDDLAAKRYRDGKAPFILVSGGYVHPDHTEYAEAIEMKRDLSTRLGVPADAILIDPHARHTTTNLRNAARIIYRYGMPFSGKALVTTDPSQSQMIESPAFEKRCLTEMSHMPVKLAGRISPFDLEFLPLIEALHADPADPLDP
jgi:hypothetical protein